MGTCDGASWRKLFALELAKKGMNIIVVARRADKLEELKKEIENSYSREVLIIKVVIPRDDYKSFWARL